MCCAALVLLLAMVMFSDSVSGLPDWTRNHYVTKDELIILVLLFPSEARCQDYRQVPTRLVIMRC